MLRRRELHARRCVRDLVQVVDQVGWKVAAREPVDFDMPLAAMLLFWAMLRGERNFVLLCLERLGVDVKALTADLDGLLAQSKAERRADGPPVAPRRSRSFHYGLDPFVRAWLDRAQRESRLLGNPFLGEEHLLLAILAGAEPPLAAMLAHHGLDYARLREAVLAEPARASPSHLAKLLLPTKPFGARWDTPAVGVPRRFSLAMMLLMTAAFAALFAALRVMGTPTEVFIMVAVFFAGIVVGQPILFGGLYPRAASLWIGGVLLPVEVLALMVYAKIVYGEPIPVAGDICATIASIPFGVGFGYVAGCLAAGMFCIVDWREKRRRSRATPGATQEDEKDGRAEEQRRRE